MKTLCFSLIFSVLLVLGSASGFAQTKKAGSPSKAVVFTSFADIEKVQMKQSVDGNNAAMRTVAMRVEDAQKRAKACAVQQKTVKLPLPLAFTRPEPICWPDNKGGWVCAPDPCCILFWCRECCLGECTPQ